MARIKTRHVGVYYRLAKNRPLFNGRPDSCFDICYRMNDKLVWEKVGWKSEGFSIKDALALRAERVKQRWEAKTVKPDGLTVDEAWQKYAQIKLPTLKASQAAHASYECHISPHFGHRHLASITEQDIEDFKVVLMRTKKLKGNRQCLKLGTVKRILLVLQGFLNKVHEWKLPGAENTPAGTCFRVQGANVKRERYLTPKEASRILDDLRIIDCDLYYIVKIALYTGMRLTEILTLQGQQINLARSLIFIDGKTGQRPVFVPIELITDLQRIIPTDPAEYVFKTKSGSPKNTMWASNKFTRIINYMGLNDGVTDTRQQVVFHTLRHTFCSWLAIKGVPILTIAKLAGHKTIAMTQRYAKLSPDCQMEALEHIEKMLKEK